MTAQTPAARKAAQRKRDKAAGIARLDLRAYLEDHQAIKIHAAMLTAKRKKASNSVSPLRKKRRNNMSAYSSLRITRAKAQAELMKAVLSGSDDKLLEEFMDRLLEPRLYNAVIVADVEQNDDDMV